MKSLHALAILSLVLIWESPTEARGRHGVDSTKTYSKVRARSSRSIRRPMAPNQAIRRATWIADNAVANFQRSGANQTAFGTSMPRPGHGYNPYQYRYPTSPVWNPNNWYSNYANYYRYTPYYYNGVQMGGGYFPSYYYSPGYQNWRTYWNRPYSAPYSYNNTNGNNWRRYQPYSGGTYTNYSNQPNNYTWNTSGSYPRPGSISGVGGRLSFPWPTTGSYSGSGTGANGGSYSYSLQNGQLTATGTGPGGSSVTYTGNPTGFNISGSSRYPWY